jgi:glutathione synthase/RimK-type ligase-like ATP-grasp enzyme
MHSPEYIKLIRDEASSLGIDVNFFTGNWAIQLSKSGVKKFIVGYTFPLNDSACYKMIRNKNLCSEILTANSIPNVPHQLIFTPAVLEKRKNGIGNFKIIQQFIAENGFPFLIKKNNSTKGEGVYLLNNEPELEAVLADVYATELTFCLSPFRENIREYRNVVLDGKCLLSYEKQIPFVTGNGQSTLIELISAYVKANKDLLLKKGKIFDSSLSKRFTETPSAGVQVFLQWKHNRLLGTHYALVEEPALNKLAVAAAAAVNARFVTVDIIYSPPFGYEVMEINASVGIHFAFSHDTSPEYAKAAEIFRLALKATFSTI